ncbi:retrotransposon protein, putative, ty1-copia subclass [Tanacetum coccineum]
MNRKKTSIMELHSLLQTAEQGIKKINIPSTLAAPVLTIGHNGLKESRRLKHGELNLVLRNRKIMPVTRIGNHNGNVILNVGSSNELDKSKLWHSRLGHINKKCIAQLQKDGVLESFDFKSDDVCESCLLGKMTKSLFTGSCERVIQKSHLDICFTNPRIIWYFVTRRGVFLKREMISKKDSGSKIDLEEIQEPVDKESIVNTDTQQEVVTLVKFDGISLSIRKTSGIVSKAPQFYYGFHIEEDNISDSTLSELDEPANYKEAMASLRAAKWKEAMKSKI